MTQLDSALAGLDLSPEQEASVRAYVASKTKRYNVNSNKVTAKITLSNGTELTLGIGKKLGNVRVWPAQPSSYRAAGGSLGAGFRGYADDS